MRISERLFHVSDIAGITRFEPRADAHGRHLVWAIGESRLHNYLLPRDCPRVTYYATAATTAADRAAFFSASNAESVIAIEKTWLPALQNSALHVYELASETFQLEDAVAAYYVCPRAVTPVAHYEVPVPLHALLERPIELRLLSSLWPLRDAVVASSLGFSIIRLRNASARE
jgi:hypothetical protein